MKYKLKNVIKRSLALVLALGTTLTTMPTTTFAAEVSDDAEGSTIVVESQQDADSGNDTYTVTLSGTENGIISFIIEEKEEVISGKKVSEEDVSEDSEDATTVEEVVAEETVTEESTVEEEATEETVTEESTVEEDATEETVTEESSIEEVTTEETTTTEETSELTVESTDVTVVEASLVSDNTATYDAGEIVKMSVSANEGYSIESFSALQDDGSGVEYVASEDGTYSFTMPASNVTVTVTFTENAEDAEYVTFDHYFSEIDESLVTTPDLIVKTGNPGVFTKNTNVVSNYDNAYIISCDSVEQARYVYSYYVDKVDTISDMAQVISVSTEVEEEEVITDIEEETTTETSEDVILEEDVADLSNLNNDTDVLSTLNDVVEETTDYSGYIALIDTGANADVNFSVIGDDATDNNGHGTKMLDLIRRNNPDAKVMSIKVSEDSKTDAASVYAGIMLAIESNVSVINLSLVGYDTENNAIVKDAIQQALDAGIVVIGAAGNYGLSATKFIPASVEGVISVGAVNEDGTLYETSNYDADVYVVATSTSEATAIYTGLYTAGKLDDERIFTSLTEEVEEEEEAEEEDGFTTADSVYISKGSSVSYDNYSTSWYTVTMNGQSYTGLCAQPSYDSPEGTYTYYEYKGSDHDLMVYIILCSAITGMYGTSDTNLNYAMAHACLGYLYNNGDVTGLTAGGAQNVANQVAAWQGVSTLSGTNLSDYHLYFTNGGSYQDIAWVVYENPTGYVKLQKSSSNTTITNGNSNYSLAGAVYGVYSDSTCSTLLGTLTTDASGNSNTVTLNAGTYYVKEISAPTGYKLNSTVYTATITSGSTYTVYATDEPMADPIQIVLRKIGENGSIASPALYTPSLANAIFTVEYYDGYYTTAAEAVASGSPTRTFKYKTNSNGWLNLSDATLLTSGSDTPYTKNGTIVFPAGTLVIKETQAPEGYLVNNTVWTAVTRFSSSGTRTLTIYADGVQTESQQISAGQTANMNTTALEEQIRGGVCFQKLDSETGKAEPQGRATLKNAEITIYAAETIYDNLNQITYNEGDEVAIIYTDEDGYATTANDTLVYGNYYAKETGTPEGYNMDEDWQADFKIETDGEIVDCTNNPIEDPIIRADLIIYKVDEDGNAYANIPFLVSLLDENGEVVESHVIVTDEDGYINTATRSKTDDTVNSLDSYVKDGVFTDEDALASAGDENIWFGEQSARLDSRGSLIYGNYVIQELQCEANAGEDLLTKYLFTSDEEMKEEFKEGAVLTLSSIFVDLIPDQESEFVDADNGSHYTDAIGEQTLLDTYSVNHLKSSSTYKLVTQLVYESRDGKTTTVVDEKSQVFSPEEVHENLSTTSATLTTEFAIDTTDYDGGTLYAVNYLYRVYDKYDVLITDHNTDLDTESQKVYIPYISTTARDLQTGDHVGTAAEDSSIIDTVSFENLRNGELYVFEATLRYADSGEVVLDADGNECVVTRLVRCNHSATGTRYNALVSTVGKDGEIEMPAFEFDASELGGQTLVVTEEVYDYDDVLENGGSYNDIPDSVDAIIEHYDLSDEDQSIHYVKIETTAADENTGTRTAVVTENAGETTTITDAVSLSNLIVGMNYTINGTLVYQIDCVDANGISHEQGEVLATHEPVTITATATEMTVNIEFEVDSSALAGLSGVVFEDVTHNDVVVATHYDYEAETQTPNWPKVETSAIDGDTNTHVGTVTGVATIVDTVELTNLTVGDSYKVLGILMNTDGTEFVVNGSTVTVESEVFTATEKNTTLDLTFTFDSSALSGESLVVYETLYFISDEKGEIDVSRHEEPDDEGQTVYYPSIATSAIDEDTGDHVGSIWGQFINFVKNLFGIETEEDETQTIIDTVSLSNLVPGETYVVSGKLYNVTKSHETGVDTPLVIDGEEIVQAVTITVSDDGKTIAAPDGSKTSVTSYDADTNTTDGTVDLIYTLDSSKIQGIEVVVFEKLYQDSTYTKDTNPDDVDDKDLVNEHSDIDDKNQSVSEIGISTTAVDTNTGDHTGVVPTEDIQASITDEVNLTYLVSDMEYTIEGALVSLTDSDLSVGIIYYLKEDGTLTQDRSEAYTQSLTFTAEAETESYELTFDITSDLVQGKSITVFENIYHNDVCISSHPDFSDDNTWDEEDLSSQTVYYPTGKTNATDNTTGEHTSDATSECTITDRVYFENLIAGEEYSITGQVVYQEDCVDANDVEHKAGDPVTDKVTVTFTASENLTTAYYVDTTEEAESEDIETEDTEEEISAKEAAIDSVTVTTINGDTVISGYVSIEFSVDASELAGQTLVVFEEFKHNDVTILVHADLEDLPQTIKIPNIGTTASVFDLDEAAIVDENGDYIDIAIIDTVAYENLWTAEELAEMRESAKYVEYLDGTYRESDTEIYTISEDEDALYIIKGILMDKATGEPLVNKSGEQYVAYSEVFSPEFEDGSQDVEFILNAGDFIDEETGENLLAGATLVVYEDLYLVSDVEITEESEETVNTEDYCIEDKHIAKHHDIDDVEQDIRIPDGQTHATDGEEASIIDEHADEETTVEHEALASEDMVITDTLSYENLHGGTTYIVTGTLQMVTETDEDGIPVEWEEALDDEGNIITQTVEFTTEGEYEDSVSGTVSLTFTFSGLLLAGETLVAFEELSREGTVIFVHADITDEAQTIYVPEIHTNATDDATGDHDGHLDEEITITDVVTYENLNVGQEYTVTGVLMDKETGKELLVDGKEVTGETTFVAETTDGEVEVTFTFDSSALVGKTVVVFEDLYHEDKVIAIHHDIDDENQAVVFPEISTNALDKANGTQTMTLGDSVTLVDMVFYKGLTAGKRYVIKGEVMDKETGDTIGVTAEATFTAEASDGETEVEFTVNTNDYQGESLVVFEEVYDTKGNLLVSHQDLDNEDQTVDVPVAPPVVSTGDMGNFTKGLVAALIALLAVIAGIFAKKRKTIRL